MNNANHHHTYPLNSISIQDETVHPRRPNGHVYLEIHVELFTVSHKHQPLKGHAYVGAQPLCNVQSGSVISVFTVSSWNRQAETNPHL